MENIVMKDGSKVRKKVEENEKLMKEKMIICREDEKKYLLRIIVMWELMMIEKFGLKSY
jgi:hypothetical protein